MYYLNAHTFKIGFPTFVFIYFLIYNIFVNSCSHFMLVDAFDGLDNFIELSIIYLSGNACILIYFQACFPYTK